LQKDLIKLQIVAAGERLDLRRGDRIGRRAQARLDRRPRRIETTGDDDVGAPGLVRRGIGRRRRSGRRWCRIDLLRRLGGESGGGKGKGRGDAGQQKESVHAGDGLFRTSWSGAMTARYM
jgi:hypothetical protein